MTRRNFLISGAFACLPTLRAQSKGSIVIVQVSYTGSGSVDDSHKIYVALWDSPDFATHPADVMPLDTKAVAAKSAEARFGNVSSDQVYISLVYDPTGTYDGDSAPPAGASIGFYSAQPGLPSPITLHPGKTTIVAVKLDDSIKMP